MKNRKTVVVAFLLVAVMLLGVGYAALTDTLTIGGSADITKDGAQNSFNEDIYFSNAEANNGHDVVEIMSGDPDTATFTINSLSGKGDKAQITFTIRNDGDLSANVTPSLADNDEPEYFNIYSDWRDGENNILTKTLAAGGTITYTLTVELLKTPTEAHTGQFTVRLDVESIDAP